MKKIIIFAVVLVMLFSLVPVAKADDTFYPRMWSAGPGLVQYYYVWGWWTCANGAIPVYLQQSPDTGWRVVCGYDYFPTATFKQAYMAWLPSVNH